MHWSLLSPVLNLKNINPGSPQEDHKPEERTRHLLFGRRGSLAFSDVRLTSLTVGTPRI
jgi:hypothetical protein